jgi:uncharacterized membrane protein YfcA
MSLILLLQVALAMTTIFYLGVLFRATAAARKEPGKDPVNPTPLGILVGAVTNFFDTLGIGSYATTTTLFRQFKMVRDEIIPGTMNVGHTLPTIAQAFIFTRLIPVDGLTLVSMILAAVLGAYMGAGIVAGWPRRNVQIGMGLALIVAATILLFRNLLGDPTGSNALGLTGPLLLAGVLGNFVLGAFMTLGIGLYAPCMILVSMLGLNPTTAFPIMMGSCAFLMPVASVRFVKERAFHPGVTLALAIGGIPAALYAGLVVESLDLRTVKYLVVVVVYYAAIGLLLAARRERAAQQRGLAVES